MLLAGGAFISVTANALHAVVAADADVPATPGLLALWLADRLDAPRIDWALPEGAALPPEAAGFRIPSVLLGA